jgi:hypothetical protein
MPGSHQRTTRYWEGPLPILQWGQAALPNVPWPQAAGGSAAAPSPVPDIAALRTTIGELIARVPKAANGNNKRRQELLSLAVDAGRLLNKSDIAAAADRILELRRMLDAAEADSGPPPPEVPRPLPQSGANQNAPSSLARPSAPNLPKDPPRKHEAPAVTANATPAISEHQPVTAQERAALSAQRQPDGQELREVNLDKEKAPDSKFWEQVFMPTPSPQIAMFRRKARGATGAQNNAPPPVGQPSVAPVLSNPAPTAPAPSPPNQVELHLQQKAHEEQPQQNRPGNLVPDALPQKPSDSEDDVVSDREDKARRAQYEAEERERLGQIYEQRRAEVDPKLKSMPLAPERSKIGDAALRARQPIIDKDSVIRRERTGVESVQYLKPSSGSIGI